MYVACSTLCFGSKPLEGALKAIRDLRFAKADLAIHAAGPHLRPADVAADPVPVAQKLRASNLGFAAFHLHFGAADGDAARGQLKACCRLARLLAVPVVTVAADPPDPARLADWAAVAAADGVMLTVETDAACGTADPAVAAGLCQRVPGLGLTLDPSHFVGRGDPPAAVDALYPLVRHVRLRDTAAGPDQFQVRVGQGQVEYGRVVGLLDRHRYDRALTVDIRDVPDGPFAVEPEVRKLKYLLESLV